MIDSLVLFSFCFNKFHSLRHLRILKNRLSRKKKTLRQKVEYKYTLKKKKMIYFACVETIQA